MQPKFSGVMARPIGINTTTDRPDWKTRRDRLQQRRLRQSNMNSTVSRTPTINTQMTA